MTPRPVGIASDQEDGIYSASYKKSQGSIYGEDDFSDSALLRQVLRLPDLRELKLPADRDGKCALGYFAAKFFQPCGVGLGPYLNNPQISSVCRFRFTEHGGENAVLLDVGQDLVDDLVVNQRFPLHHRA